MLKDIASANEKHFAPCSCGKMSSKQGIGSLGTLIALLIVFDGSKQILNLSFVSLTVMLLHQAVGSYCRHIFPSLSILFNCFLILACSATGVMASWTGLLWVTVGSESKETGLPNSPNPVCTSGNASRTHLRGDDIGSGCIRMFLACELSAVGRGVEASMWGFWFFSALSGDRTEWTSYAWIFTSPRFTQSEPDKREGGRFPCICESLKT